jgi:hypothetical protein
MCQCYAEVGGQGYQEFSVRGPLFFEYHAASRPHQVFTAGQVDVKVTTGKKKERISNHTFAQVVQHMRAHLELYTENNCAISC